MFAIKMNLPVYYYFSVNTINRACDQILETGASYLGFDTETDNSFKFQGQHKDETIIEKADVVSLATGTAVYVFQLSNTAYCVSLNKLLKSPKITKVGVGLKGDISKLKNMNYSITNELDLQHIALICNCPLALDDMWNRLFPQHPPLPNVKHQNVSWSEKLTPSLIDYAARDAHAALMLIQKFLSLPVAAPLDKNITIIYDNANGVVTNSNNDHQGYLAWIKNQLGQDRTLQTLINQTCNSYGPWINTIPSAELPKRANEALLHFAQNGDLKYNPQLKIFLAINTNNDNVSNNVIVVDKHLSKNDIRAITGLKVKSARNYLFNSSTTFSNCVAKAEVINATLESAIAGKQITIVNDKIYPMDGN